MKHKIFVSVLLLVCLFAGFSLIYNSQSPKDKEIKRLYNEQTNIAIQKSEKKIEEELHYKKFNEGISIATGAFESIQGIKNEILELENLNNEIYKQIQTVTIGETQINIEELNSVLVETLSFTEDR